MILMREIDYDMFDYIVEDIRKKAFGNIYAIITDSNVEEMYAKRLAYRMEKKGLDFCLLTFPAGEQSKNLAMAGELCDKLNDYGIDRTSCVIALGGGVVGDLVGFVASFYMRRILYIQIPTTLVAQVDSSIGGKTAVDSIKEKNLMGSFYQPKKAISTLPH